LTKGIKSFAAETEKLSGRAEITANAKQQFNTTLCPIKWQTNMERGGQTGVYIVNCARRKMRYVVRIPKDL